MHALVISLFLFLYAYESFTLTADLENRIQATEMRYFRKILGITYRDHVTNEEVRNRIKQTTGPHEDLLATVKKKKTEVVRPCFTIIRTCQNKKAEEKMGRKHPRMDRLASEGYSEKDGGLRKLESAGCQIICCALTVIQSMG